jgi:hypothetical protein
MEKNGVMLPGTMAKTMTKPAWETVLRGFAYTLLSGKKPQGELYGKAFLSAQEGRHFLRLPGQSRDGGTLERPLYQGKGIRNQR